MLSNISLLFRLSVGAECGRSEVVSHLCWVNLHDHLLATQEWVADELARSKRDWLLAVGHFDYVGSEDCLEGETDVELSLGHWRWIGFGGQKFVVAKAGYSKLVA